MDGIDHLDLVVRDLDRSLAFYADLFGWTAEAPAAEFGGYVNLSKDGIRVAGAMTNDGSSGAPDGTSTPVLSSITTSQMPETLLARTGIWAAMASMRTRPKPSAAEGRTSNFIFASASWGRCTAP